MAKNALVISGGGAKGSFAVGVLKYILLNKPEIKFDIICGTSTGALITPYAALGNVAAEVSGAVLVVQGSLPVPTKEAADQPRDSGCQLPVDVRRDAEPA